VFLPKLFSFLIIIQIFAKNATVYLTKTGWMIMMREKGRKTMIQAHSFTVRDVCPTVPFGGKIHE